MVNVQVVYASRHGATAGIAERIGDVLRAQGATVVVASAGQRPDPGGFDAYVVGSAVYMGRWLDDATDWLERHTEELSARPVWLLSSGPLPGSTNETPGTDALTNALGPIDGPGSGGRKRVEALAAVIHPRDHGVFRGAFYPTDPPKALSERVVRMMPVAKGILPSGDYREWDKIEAWARGVAAALDSIAPPVVARA